MDEYNRPDISEKHFKKLHCYTFLSPNANAGKKRDNDYDLYITDQRKYYKDTYTIKHSPLYTYNDISISPDRRGKMRVVIQSEAIVEVMFRR